MIRPEDESKMVRFHRVLSERTVWMRYFHPLQYEQRVAHERLVRICFSDYDRELALVAELETPGPNQERDIIAVGRLSKIPFTNDGEFALLVSDQWQRQGLGSELLRMIVEIGRSERLSRIFADILPENLEMQTVAQKNGFHLTKHFEEQRVVAEIKLDHSV
jgi:acetyltransferase